MASWRSVGPGGGTACPSRAMVCATAAISMSRMRPAWALTHWQAAGDVERGRPAFGMSSGTSHHLRYARLRVGAVARMP
jgi:hypothetical protein